MLTRVASAKSATGQTLIVIEDKCLGKQYYLKPNNCDIYSCFVLFTIHCYESRNILASSNLLRCFKHAIATYGVNPAYIVDVVSRDWNKICPGISKTKYMNLINRVILPQL